MPRQQGQDGRAAILAVAAKLFYEQGLEEVSVETVAAAAGLTKRALYYHFPTKHDLVVAYLEEADEPALTLLRQLSKTNVRPESHPFERLFEGLRKWLKSGRFHGCAFLRAARSYPDDRQVLQKSRQHKDATLAWLAAVSHEAGDPQPEKLALQVRLLLDGILASGQLYDPDLLVDTAERSLAALIDAGREKSSSARQRKV